MRSLLPLVAVAALLGGCGQEDDESGVRAVTAGFYSALEAGDGQAACARLSVDVRAQLESREQRECREAVTGLELQGGAPARVEVYMLSARVELAGGESAFLSRGAEGWRLSAVGCRPEPGEPPDAPYECEAEA